MDVQSLSEGLEALRSEIADLEALETPTDEQTARFAAALDEWDTQKAAYDQAVDRAARVEQVRSFAADPANVQPAFAAPAVHVRTDVFSDLDRVRNLADGEREIRDLALRAIEQTGGRARSEHLDEAARKVEEIDGVARMALAFGSPAYRSAFARYLRAQGQQPLFTPEEADAVRAAMSLTTGNGGFAVPFLLDPTLIKTGTATKNPIRRLARVEQGTSNKWNGITISGVTTYWTPEANAFTEGAPTTGQPTITAAKLTAYVPGSFEVWQDTGLQSRLPELIGEGFDLAEAGAFVSGSGSDAPKGIVTAISATAGSTVTATTRGSFGSVDLFAVVDALPVRYEDSATWLANKKTFSTIRQWSSGSTGSLFFADLGSAAPANLLEFPYVKAADVASATTSGTVLMILGDFSQYLIYDRLGTTVEFDPIVVNTNGLPTGQRALIAHKRVGADVADVNGFRFLKT